MYQTYSQKMEQRRLARERAIAWKVIKTTVKTFLVLGAAGAIALFALYHILIYTIDGQIDQSNIQNCENLRTVQLEQWQKAKSQCQQYYETESIDYLRQNYEHVENFKG